MEEVIRTKDDLIAILRDEKDVIKNENVEAAQGENKMADKLVNTDLTERERESLEQELQQMERERLWAALERMN